MKKTKFIASFIGIYKQYFVRVICMSIVTGVMILDLFVPNLDVTAKTNTKLIGHRGYSSKYIENTASSMAGAYRKGFSGVEMDVYEAKDGTLWVFHDRTLRRMTGKNGSIYNLTKSNRKKYRYRNGSKINTLEEVLSKIQGKKRVYIHLKGNGKKSFLSEEAQNRIEKDIQKYDLIDQVILFAGPSKMKKIHVENAKIGWYSEEKSHTKLKKMIRFMKKYQATELVLLDTSQYKSKAKGKKLTAYAHENNVNIGLYKTQTKKQYKFMKSVNADFAFSNYYLK